MTYITLGGGPLGDLFTEVDDDVATATVQRAWDRGVRCFDTAPHYGLGLSETRIGRVVSAMSRDSFQMSTKVGRMLVESDDRCVVADSEGFSVETVLRRRWDFSAYGVRRSLDDSLVRLGLSRIDTVYIHDPDDHLDEACDQAFPALVELRDGGVIGAVGLGTHSVVVAQEFPRRCPIDVLMIAGRLTLLDQSVVDDVLPLCSTVAYCPLVSRVPPTPSTMRLRRSRSLPRRDGSRRSAQRMERRSPQQLWPCLACTRQCGRFASEHARPPRSMPTPTHSPPAPMRRCGPHWSTMACSTPGCCRVPSLPNRCSKERASHAD